MTLLGAYPEALEMVDEDGNTVLRLAVISDNPFIDIVQTIISRRAQLCQAVDVGGDLPLHQYLL